MKLRVIVIALVPVAWLALAGIVQQTMGPYSAFDPDYYYLLSSLDLAEFKTLGIYHHPGTPVALLGAAVVSVMHLVGGSGDSIQAAVLADPEAYLIALHTSTAVLIAVGVAVVGAVTLRATQSVWLTLFLQAAAFLTPVVALDSAGRFKPEPFLLFACLLLMAAIVWGVRGGNPEGRRLPVALGAVCGLGLATKFTFMPLLVIPFLFLAGLKRKAQFVFWTAIATVVFTLPIANQYSDLFSLLFANVSHTGLYGTGERGVVELNTYRQGLAALVAGNRFLNAVVIVALIAVALAIGFGRRGNRAALESREFRALCAVLASLILGVVMVSKYALAPGVDRYLFCSYCLLGLTLWLSASTYLKLGLDVPVIRPLLLVALGCLVADRVMPVAAEIRIRLGGLTSAHQVYGSRDARRAELEQRAPKDHARIYDLGTQRTPLNGLFQATYYSKSHLDALGKAFPDAYFCDSGNCTPDNWTTKHFVGLDHEEITVAGLKARYGDRIVLIYGALPEIEAVK